MVRHAHFLTLSVLLARLLKGFKVPLGRKFIGLFRPNSVAEYRVVSIFPQKTEQQTFHPNIFWLQSRIKCVRHY